MTINPNQAVNSTVNLLPQPVLPDLFQRLEGEGDRQGLVGAYCELCDRHFFPAPDHCPDCHGPVERRVFGGKGRVYSFTVVRTKAPFSLPEPYAVGYVDLADVPLRVFALLDPLSVGSLSIGQEVILRALPLGVDAAGMPCIRPVFCLETGSLEGTRS